MTALLTCLWLDRTSKQQNINGRNHRGKYVDKAKNMQLKKSNDYWKSSVTDVDGSPIDD